MAEVAFGSRAKRFAVSVVLLLLSIVGVAVLLSTPSTQTRLVGWAFGALETRFGIVGHAERVDLDLSRLDIRLRGLTLAVCDHEDEPFFRADEARIDLPWSALWDELSIQAVELVRPWLSVRIASGCLLQPPHGHRPGAGLQHHVDAAADRGVRPA